MGDSLSHLDDLLPAVSKSLFGLVAKLRLAINGEEQYAALFPGHPYFRTLRP